MAAKDIRRQTEDIDTTAARYVRPGVVNTAIGDAITGVGGSLIELDAALAKERLGKQLDASRAEFIVGETNDAASGEGGGSTNDPELQRALDAELAPFKKQLGSMSNAQQQGLLRGDRFRMQADAILQQAIARRPGLAPELRELHASYTGGAIIETLMRREQELYDEAIRAAKAAKGDPEDIEKRRMFQLNLMKEAGFSAEAGSMAYSSPEEVNAKYMELYPQISRMESTKSRASTLKAAAEGIEAGYHLDRPASLQTWQGQYDLALEGVLKTLRESRPMLAAATEEEFAGMVGEWYGAIAKVKSNLESQRTALGLKPEDVASQMEIIAKMEEQGSKLLDGSMEMDERKRRIESFQYQLEANLQGDSPLIASLAYLEKLGAHETVKYMYDSNKQLARQTGQEMQKFIVDGAGAGRPEMVSPLAGGFSQSLLKSMFPKGSQTKNPDVDMPAAMHLLTNYGVAFAATPSDQFKVKPYTEWIEELSAFTTPLTTLTDEQQKKDLAEAVRISAHKALRVGYLSLLAQYPQLKGNLTFNNEGEVNEPYRLKDETDNVVAKAVDQANQQMAFGKTVTLLQTLGGYSDPVAAHKHILQSADELMGQENKAALARSEQAAKDATTQRGSGGAGGAVGPAVGAVETDEAGDKWRFKGGDPASPDSWERME